MQPDQDISFLARGHHHHPLVAVLQYFVIAPSWIFVFCFFLSWKRESPGKIDDDPCDDGQILVHGVHVLQPDWFPHRNLLPQGRWRLGVRLGLLRMTRLPFADWIYVDFLSFQFQDPLPT